MYKSITVQVSTTAKENKFDNIASLGLEILKGGMGKKKIKLLVFG
jgi:hypothetical protein